MRKTFKDLGLSAVMMKAVDKKGFEEPTEIQELVIPALLRGDSNIIAQAQTGTGKTAAFALPIIEKINIKSKAVQALILAPTRELAVQVAEEINSLKGDSDISVVPIYGGQSIDQQLRKLKKGVHIVVGTPGRVIDHLNRRTLKLGGIDYLVLDEADEMLNMGFVEDMEEIMKHSNPARKTLLFSATMPNKIKQLAGKYMDGYKFISVKKQPLTTNLTEQIYFEVRAVNKFEALCRIIDIEDDFYGLVFCRTKQNVDEISSRLIDRGYEAEAIHGDISQAQRERTLSKFKKQRINILVATDVAARGIDVNNLTHVINYSLPQDPESYVHRIGRTGRAGNEGTAITFITPSEYNKLMFIQKAAGVDIRKFELPAVKDIINAKKQKLYDDFVAMQDEKINDNYYSLAKALLADNHPTEILAAVLNYCLEDDLNPDAYTEIKPGRKKDKSADMPGKARLFVALGKKDKITPKKLVSLITAKTSVRPADIKDIQIMEKFSFINVPFDKAEEIVVNFKSKGRKSRSLIAHAKK